MIEIADEKTPENGRKRIISNAINLIMVINFHAASNVIAYILIMYDIRECMGIV